MSYYSQTNSRIRDKIKVSVIKTISTPCQVIPRKKNKTMLQGLINLT